jgi:O-methyltransferase involved in polyketide biosynthesis
VMMTLRFIASGPVGSGVVFDYMLSPSLLTPAQRSYFDAIAQRVSSAGEPWKTFFDPGLLTMDLEAMGFGHSEDNGPEKINTRYFRDRRDGLRVGSLSHIMSARV